MSVAPPLTVEMSARAVIARGLEFVPRGATYADAQIARDEIFALPRPAEPLLLRVTTRGGSKSERALVAGDWLFDPALTEPVRLPRPRWEYDAYALAWSKSRPWLEAWETCGDAVWMLDAAANVQVDPRELIRSACACVRASIGCVPEGERRPLRALEEAEAWTRKEATSDAARAAAERAYGVTRVTASGSSLGAAASSACNAAAHVAMAASRADTYRAVGQFTALMSMAVYAAEMALTTDPRGLPLATLADVVRAQTPTLLVLRAAARQVRR